MTEQLFYEDIDVGTEITTLPKIATTSNVIRWAGATGNFDPLHYDEPFAKARRLERPIVHGAMKRAWLGQMMNEWIGKEGALEKLACYYIKVDYPRYMKTMTESQDGETWLCKGKVTGKHEESGNHFVECQIWVENGQGERTAPGNATVTLPSKA